MRYALWAFLLNWSAIAEFRRLLTLSFKGRFDSWLFIVSLSGATLTALLPERGDAYSLASRLPGRDHLLREVSL